MKQSRKCGNHIGVVDRSRSSCSSFFFFLAPAGSIIASLSCLVAVLTSHLDVSSGAFVFGGEGLINNGGMEGHARESVQ